MTAESFMMQAPILGFNLTGLQILRKQMYFYKFDKNKSDQKYFQCFFQKTIFIIFLSILAGTSYV
jgi:hypothetical protein